MMDLKTLIDLTKVQLDLLSHQESAKQSAHDFQFDAINLQDFEQPNFEPVVEEVGEYNKLSFAEQVLGGRQVHQSDLVNTVLQISQNEDHFLDDLGRQLLATQQRE